MVADWDLVCGRAGLRATVQPEQLFLLFNDLYCYWHQVGAAPMAGYLLGGFVFGLLTDKLGRKPTFLIANSLMALGGLAAAAAPEFFTFVAARVLVGFPIAGVEAACFVMGMEMVSCELLHIV